MEPMSAGPTSRRDSAGSGELSASLGKEIRAALQDYLQGRKLVRFQVRKMERRTIEGFLKIEGDGGDLTLVDFKATATPSGALSSLWVGGKRIGLALGPAPKRGSRSSSSSSRIP
jgi:hypothetical protein